MRATELAQRQFAARLWGSIDLEDLNHATNFKPRRAYGDARLANILFRRELQTRFGDQGISAVVFHPGAYYEKGKIAKTNMQASDPILGQGFWDLSAAMLGLEQ